MIVAVFLLLSLRELDAVGCGTRPRLNVTDVPKDITENVLFQFYDPEYGSLDNYTKIPFECGLSILDQPGYDPKAKTIISMSGYTERPSVHSTHESVYYVVNGVTKYLNANLIVINYETLVRGRFHTLVPIVSLGVDYVRSIMNATTIGHTLSRFFKSFLSECNCRDDLHVIAVSLGVHIFHHVARRLDGEGIKLKRVTALEAAGPLFYLTGDRFSKDDAVFVDAVHTDGGGLGFSKDYGTVDFYVNGGSGQQPGCSDTTLLKGASFVDSFKCNHYMALFYYIESMRKPRAFLAVKCENYKDWTKLMCTRNRIDYFGYYVGTNLTGRYYLNTNKRPPYALGRKGIVPLNSKTRV